MMKKFVEDVEQGRHESEGWPNTCYGMSKLGLIAYTNVSFGNRCAINHVPRYSYMYSRISDFRADRFSPKAYFFNIARRLSRGSMNVITPFCRTEVFPQFYGDDIHKET